jgi:hypothetical protein
MYGHRGVASGPCGDEACGWSTSRPRELASTRTASGGSPWTLSRKARKSSRGARILDAGGSFAALAGLEAPAILPIAALDDGPRAARALGCGPIEGRDEELKRRGRGISDDMSPDAIGNRIEIVGQLHRMWQMLRQAECVGPVQPADQVAEPEPRARRKLPGGG